MKCTLSPVSNSPAFGTLWFKDSGVETLNKELGKKSEEFQRKVDAFENIDVYVSKDKIAIMDNDLLEMHYVNKENPISRFMGHIVGNFDHEKYYVPSGAWSKSTVKKYGETPAQKAYAVVEKVVEELSQGKSTLKNFVKLYR